jgi:hypothetical protein
VEYKQSVPDSFTHEIGHLESWDGMVWSGVGWDGVEWCGVD